MSQTAQPLRENINVPFRRYRSFSFSKRREPFEQIVRDVHKSPLARFGLDAFDFDGPVHQINFCPVKDEELRSSKPGE
jgi:hypothetical protein